MLWNPNASVVQRTPRAGASTTGQSVNHPVNTSKRSAPQGTQRPLHWFVNTLCTHCSDFTNDASCTEKNSFPRYNNHTSLNDCRCRKGPRDKQ